MKRDEFKSLEVGDYIIWRCYGGEQVGIITRHDKHNLNFTWKNYIDTIYQFRYGENNTLHYNPPLPDYKSLQSSNKMTNYEKLSEDEFMAWMI